MASPALAKQPRLRSRDGRPDAERDGSSSDPKRLLSETPDDWHDRRPWPVQRAIRIAMGAAMRLKDWKAYARYRDLAILDGWTALEILHLDGLRAPALAAVRRDAR